MKNTKDKYITLSYTNGSHVWPRATFYWAVKNPNYIPTKDDDKSSTNYRSNKVGGSGGTSNQITKGKKSQIQKLYNSFGSV